MIVYSSAKGINFNDHLPPSNEMLPITEKRELRMMEGEDLKLKRQGPNSNYIDDVMDDLQEELMARKIMFIGVMRDVGNGNPQQWRDAEKLGLQPQQMYPNWPAPVINVTVNPVINTTSSATESTKNSPLRELGSFLAPLFRIKK